MPPALPHPTIAILSIGQMGLGIASLLQSHAYQVTTSLRGRSDATKNRAMAAGIKVADGDEEVIQGADYVLSIVPPKDAVATAERVVRALESNEKEGDVGGDGKGDKGKVLYYLDLNAISPGTARQIDTLFSRKNNNRTGDKQAGRREVVFIDGGIIGGPPSPPKSPSSSTETGGAPGTEWTRPDLPLSGPNKLPSTHLASLLNTRHISNEIGSASGLKCCFAALTKGFTALALQSFTTASSLGVLPHLQEYMDAYNPDAKAKAERGVVGCTGKAYRWVEEMRQIGECFEGEGGWKGRAGVFREIAEVFQGLADVVEREGSAEGMESVERVVGVLGDHLRDDLE
ncbi:6-phosphogluconate dehydrogenase [Stemphylium lycopersici]|nr:6-phosphogluconate dehydrogenase [Stemphylium lycopersici]